MRTEYGFKGVVPSYLKARRLQFDPRASFHALLRALVRALDFDVPAFAMNRSLSFRWDGSESGS